MEPQLPPDNLTTPPPDRPAPTAPSNPLAAGGAWMVVVAALLLLCGLCSCLFYLVLPLASQDTASQVQTNVIFGSAAVFGILFGTVLVWQGINSLRGRSSISAARAFPSLPVFVFAFVGAVLLGIATLGIPPVAAYAFPPWHFFAASLPPLALLAYAAHRLGKQSGLRALLASFGWGALAATSLAFILEMLVALALILVAAVFIANLPDSRAVLQQMQAQLRLAQRTQDFSGLAQWFSNPAVTAVLVVYFALIIPPLEEAVKALVVAFIDPRRTRAADALLWGMAAGAGFAVLESMFNASVGLDAWAPLILMRGGASVLHVANGATMGLGWYAARVERRWGRLLLAYVASMVFHAVWNAAAILMSNKGLDFGGAAPVLSADTVLAGALLLVLVLLVCLGLAWIVFAVRQTHHQLERS